MTRAAIGTALLMLAACAGPAATGGGAQAKPPAAAAPGSPAVASADEDNTYVCEKVRPTGSNIPETVCRTVQQRSHERRVAQDVMTKPVPGGSPKGN